ncbi:hypothetical protein PDESU_00464 [Pontiella desulfatans]|uniref:IS66 family insertion sequence element accessory protein TnpB n=1 Tax=Pontiella desulfatans TaxID=2750659 RepID=A0A6C2TX80_PONDE|nr:hypothetical protein [Pontiella desulfatans]VGO11916.1 hypothetical protein PDESU_00464 [Pontiella desulfatans]
MNDSIPPTELTILKADTAGRVRTPIEQRNALLDAFEQSGMSGAAFAKLHGIKYPTFAYWRKRREEARNEDDARSGPFFEEIEIQRAAAGPGGLGIELPGGARLVIDRADQFPMVAALLKYLEHSC